MAQRTTQFLVLQVTCGLTAAFLCAALLVACSIGGPGANTGSLDNKPSIKIALLVPLSAQGHPGLIAKSLKQAAELALFERDNPNLQLIVKDDKGTPDGAKIAAEDVLKSGATLIMGPLFAKSVSAVAPVARKANVPVVAFSNDRQVAGNGVYLLSFQPAPEVERVVAYRGTPGQAPVRGPDPPGRVRQDGRSRFSGTPSAARAAPSSRSRPTPARPTPCWSRCARSAT